MSPEKKLTLLSLDGGGVRGLSALAIIKQVMVSVDPDNPPLPCDYFDMIGGTSTGGLIAIMLGRLKMSVDACMDAYVSMADRIFAKKRHRLTLLGQVQGRFDSEELEKCVKEVLLRLGMGPDALLRDDSSAKCKVFVCATSEQTGDTVHLTSYRSPRGREHLYRSTKIWEACRATSAATSFFDPITIGDYNEGFVDGATGANNPVGEVWNQAKDVWELERLEDHLQCLVSIGTGVPSLRPFGRNLKDISATLLKIATDTEKLAERFVRDKSAIEDGGKYYRFNVLHGLEGIALEDSSQKSAIIAATGRYLESQNVYKQLRACVNTLRLSATHTSVQSLQPSQESSENLPQSTGNSSKSADATLVSPSETTITKSPPIPPTTYEASPALSSTPVVASIQEPKSLSSQLPLLEPRVVPPQPVIQDPAAILRAVQKQDLHTLRPLLKSPHAAALLSYTDGSSGRTALHLAVDAKNNAIASLLLRADAPLDVHDSTRGWTPLHVAAANGYIYFLDLLNNFGKKENLDWGVQDDEGDSPFHVACANGQLVAVTWLLKNGAVKLGAVNFVGKTGVQLTESAVVRGLVDFFERRSSAGGSGRQGLLHFAVEKEEVELLRVVLAMKEEDIEAVDGRGYTPLAAAVAKGVVSGELMSEMLLDAGANAMAKGSNGMTPLLIACAKGAETAVEMILKHAANERHTLLSAKDIDDRNAIFLAVMNIQYRTLKLLLDAGVDWNAKDKYDLLPVHYACFNRDTQSASALFARVGDAAARQRLASECIPFACQWHIVRGALPSGLSESQMLAFLLDEAGSIPEAKQHYPRILKDALEHNKTQLLHSLSERGCKLDSTDDRGTTVLDRAIKAQRKSVINAVLDYDITLATHDNIQAIMRLACHEGNVELARKALRSDKLDLHEPDSDHGMTFLLDCIYSDYKDPQNQMLPLLLSHGADPGQGREGDQLTPLHRAAYQLLPDRIELLLRHGAYIDAENRDGETPLTHCASANDSEERVEPTIKLLLKAGADPNGGGPGRPIHEAVKNGNAKVVRILLEAGADADVTDRHGEKPISIALERNKMARPALVRVLVEKGRVKLRDLPTAELNRAMRLHDKERFNLLLEAGMSVNPKDPGDVGDIPLYLAASSGNAHMVSSLLAAGADPNALPQRRYDEDGNPPLFAAIGSENADCVKLLLDAGAKIDGPARRGETAIVWAVGLSEYSRGGRQILDMVLERRPDLKQRDGYGYPLIHRAITRGGGEYAVRRLLECGVDPTETAPGGYGTKTNALDWVESMPRTKTSHAIKDMLIRWGVEPIKRDAK